MKRKSRILSFLLAAAMMLSMVVPVAAAAPNISASAGFADDVTLSEDTDSYEASLSVDLDGLDGFTGYELVVDWGSMKDYVSSVKYSANDEVRDANGKPHDYGTHDQMGRLEPYQRYLQVYGADTIADLEGVAIVTFALDGSIPADRYPVGITVIDVIDGNAKPILNREDPSTYLHTTGILTVRNADGTLPDEPVEDAVYKISSSVDSAAGTGSVSFSKAEAQTGETVTVTLAPATGYELDSITATDTTNSAPVELVKITDTEYTFAMPAGNVQVNVSYKLSEPAIDTYSINIGTSANGTVHTNGVSEAEAGETVAVFVKPNEDLEIVSVAVTAETGVAVTVSGGTDQGNGTYKYTFAMPESDVSVDVVFRQVDESNRDDVTAGHILTKGTVLTSNNAPLSGAKVQLVYETGSNKNQVAAETVTGADGSFVLPEVSGSYTYKLQASYDTGILQGKPADPGYIVYSAVKSVSMSSSNVDSKGEVCVQTLTVSLYYEWDVDNDGTIERVYAGKDDKFLTTDDFYQTTVGGKTVNVYADDNGSIQSEKAYYLWEVNDDGVKEKVYVGGGFKAGTDNDYYMFDVDHDPKTADIEVKIGSDCIPATSDDTYTLDVNNDGRSEQVFAGTDGRIATEDDWYISEGETIFAGSDKIAGTSDDWFLGDGDGHGENKTIFTGKDRLPHTEDDFYKRDVDGDGKDEIIYAGEDARFNTSDDYYEAQVGDKPVKVYPGTGDGEDAYEFGRTDDHYSWTVGGENVTVRVGTDKIAGTADDEFGWTVKNNEGGDVPVIVKNGPDGVPGTSDDYYMYDADKDGQEEKVITGPDGISGTKNDYYVKDVNKDGKDETVIAGEDAAFGTPDDHYNAKVNTPDGGQETVPVYAGEDGKFSDPKAPGCDDWYPWDTNGDGKTEPDIYGSDPTDKVFIDGDSLASTGDDYYLADPDKDGENDKIFVGPDGIPGTSDDYYSKDVDGDGVEEDVKAGEDGKFGTDDDHYLKDVDGDGVEEDVKAGEDGKFGTADDHYRKDIDGDGTEDEFRAGADGKLGTPDDEYDKDVDNDGEKETVYVGEDTKPGTGDDWYYPDITFDAGAGKVNGAGTYTVIASAIKALPSASRSGYSFDGWSKTENGSVLTLEQVLALRVDTTLYASYSANSNGGGGSGGSGGGGGNGGGTTVQPSATLTVTFDTAGGSVVEAQTVKSGDRVVKPAAPTRYGFAFTGWYTDEARTKVFDFNTKIKTDMTLYAGWMLSDANPVFKYLTSEHIAYINGFDDGLVHAGESMTRAQAAQVFFNLLNDESKARYGTVEKDFSDVDSGSWYNEAVSTLANMGILNGYGNGLFGPEDTMTRAQFAAICVRIGDLTATGSNTFSDVATNHWAYDSISAAADAGWINGYGNGKFGPDDQITRAQVVTMLNRVMNRSAKAAHLDGLKGLRMWPDNMDPSVWYYYDLIEAGNNHRCTYDAAGVETWTGLKPIE